MDVTSASKTTVQPAQPTKKISQVQQAQQRDAAKPRETEAQKPADPKPRPVVNTQGQTTGRTLNVTA
jgi:hypothetical protein